MIEFESVGKTFRDGAAAVADLSLTVPTGRVTAIVGPAGCGKTTTLRLVNRMLEPTSGRILWDGVPLRSRRKTAVRRQMGYVLGGGGLFPHRTVAENIGTVPGLLGWHKDKARQRSTELLADVGLDRRLASRYPAQLSTGQQQRVAVARALAGDPPVLLMDEPFAAVDPAVRGELHEFFLGLQRELGKTVILVTRDIDEAILLGDQVAVLRAGGRLAQVGTPQQLLEEPADAFVEGFVGRDRGYRSLSFLPADRLPLERVRIVRDAAAADSGEPTLVVDSDARPVGWAHHDRPGHVFALGSTFVAESDTVRAALDSAMTSPYGLAVAVAPDTGRFAGVVAARRILDQVADSRTASVDAGPVPAAGARVAEEPEPADAPLAPGAAEDVVPELDPRPEPAEPDQLDQPAEPDQRDQPVEPDQRPDPGGQAEPGHRRRSSGSTAWTPPMVDEAATATVVIDRELERDAVR